MPFGSPQWMYASGSDYEIEQSLRFNDNDSAYLSRTPASAGNRQTWTWSCWYKIGKNDGANSFLHSADDSITFGTDHKIAFSCADGTTRWNTLLRDHSAWYHIIIAYDSTQSTASNRVKLYINGTQQTDDNSTYPGLNRNTTINNANAPIYISSNASPGGSLLDGYLAEINFIDGAAKAPADFGKTGTYGEWKPIEYSGTYGTNGFYLPFKQDYTVEGFSTVIYPGNSVADHYIGGTGFQPDLTWIKHRNHGTAHQHNLFDSVRGVNKTMHSNSSEAEETLSDMLSSFKPDGFTLGTSDAINDSGVNYVSWNWDMGGSNASNTTGSINSTVRANPTYGQSIVSYTGTQGNETVGHGLSSVPEMIIVKNRTNATGWIVLHKDMAADYETDYMTLNTDGIPVDDVRAWNDTEPTSSVFTVGIENDVNKLNSGYIAYCFHSVTGYSSIGSFTGNGNSSAGPSVTCGFKPAFVMFKNASSAGNLWAMYDNTRNPTNRANLALAADSTAVEANYPVVDFDANGFQIHNVYGFANDNGDTYIYMAFADKREYAYWLDQSGNNNDWTSNNLTESDISVDSPTNNFATLNPLDRDGDVVVSEGNLKALQSGAQQDAIRSSFGMSTGKWYYEAFVPTAETYIFLGLANTEWSVYGNVYDSSSNWVFQSNGGTYNGSEINTSISALSGGDIVQVAYDLDAGKIWWGVNNTWILSGNPSTAANPVYSNLSGTLAPVGSFYQAENGATFNFGQDSSFAGNKTAQGNQDGNDIGDFYYTPPTDFLALCTSNLPDVAVTPSEHFNAVAYAGNAGASPVVTGTFQPDLIWVKDRGNAEGHSIVDSIRGFSSGNANIIRSNTTGADYSGYANHIDAITTTGFTTGGSDDGVSNSSRNYIAWVWKANGSSSANTVGDINSTVSVNTDAGFSIVSWTGTNTAGGQTIGHGLSSTPEMIITKRRDDTSSWYTYSSGLTSHNYELYLNGTDAQTAGGQFQHAAPTSSVFTVYGEGALDASGGTYIAYAFHSVNGYSKFGSYTGNGSTDGTFVYTGFRVAYLLIKRSSASEGWYVKDIARNPNGNEVDLSLSPHDASAEFTTHSSSHSTCVDFLSNGFKFRGNDTQSNAASTYIYLAFAETPFKYSNAR